MMADMKVGSTVWPTTDYPGMVEAKYPNTVMFFQSAPSPLRNRVSVSLGVANVSFGPASSEYHPGDPEHVWNQMGKLLYLNYALRLIFLVAMTLTTNPPQASGPSNPGMFFMSLCSMMLTLCV